MTYIKNLLKNNWQFLPVLFLLGFLWFYTHPYVVFGDSMLPAFHNGDFLLVEEFSPRFIPLSRGEVIVFRDPRHEQHPILVKRVIGLPKETVEIFNDSVIITTAKGERITFTDALIGGEWNGNNQTMVLGPLDYFLMGDNRRVSADSRQWGTIQPSEMIGRPLLRLWPLSRMGTPFSW